MNIDKAKKTAEKLIDDMKIFMEKEGRMPNISAIEAALLELYAEHRKKLSNAVKIKICMDQEEANVIVYGEEYDLLVLGKLLEMKEFSELEQVGRAH